MKYLLTRLTSMLEVTFQISFVLSFILTFLLGLVMLIFHDPLQPPDVLKWMILVGWHVIVFSALTGAVTLLTRWISSYLEY